MEYEEENSGVAGRVPTFGAIFMSNSATKRVCFKRKLFGLPSAMANFVMQVKDGMVLFLFEFEKRELFGVYQATSDGAMNIVPDAFSSSGKHFPAQVRFTPIWICSPLSENEFQDAIRDNYFSAKKFSFGLSEDQVHRLLCLFRTRKLKNKLPQRQFTRLLTRPVGKDRRRINDDDRIERSNMVEFESDVGDDVGSSIFEYSRNSLDRVKRVADDGLLMDDVEESEGKIDYGIGRGIWTDYPGNSSGKKGRLDKDGWSLMSDVTENEHFDDYASGQAMRSEYLGDSFGEVRRLDGDMQLLRGGRMKLECDRDRNIEPVISTKCLGNSFRKSRDVADDGRFLMMEGVGNKFNLDNGFGPAGSAEHHHKPLGKVKLAKDEDGYFANKYSVENKSNVDERFGSDIVPEHYLRERGTDGRPFFMKRLENERRVGHGTGHVISSEQFGNRLGKRETDVGNLIYRNRVENEHDLDNSFGEVLTSDYSRYRLVEDRQVADDGRFNQSNRIENRRDMERFCGPNDYSALFQSKQNPLVCSSKPTVETNYSYLPDQLRHSSPFSRSKETQSFDNNYPASHDAVVTRTVPYDPDVPGISSRLSPFVAGYNSNSVLDRSSYQGSEGNLLSSSKSKSSPYHFERESLSSEGYLLSSSKNKSSPYHYEPESLGSEGYLLSSSKRKSSHYHLERESLGSEGYLLSSSKSKSSPYCFESERLRGCLDVGSAYGNQISLPNTANHDNRPSSGTPNALSKARYSEIRTLQTSPHEGQRGLLFSEPSLTSVPFSRDDTNNYPISHAFGSIKNPSFALNNGYPVDSQADHECKISRPESNGLYIGDIFPSSDAGRYRLRCGASSEARGLSLCEKYSANNENEQHHSSGSNRSDSKNNRTSVFARLSSASKVHSREQENDARVVQDTDTIASVDDIMNLLRQSQNHLIKTSKHKPLIRQHDDDESVRVKKEATIQNQIKYEQLLLTPTKCKINAEVEIDANRTIEKNGDSVLEETRLVDFKRRSEIKKKQNGEATTKGSVGISEGKISNENASQKRRKLIRPAFGKNDSNNVYDDTSIKAPTSSPNSLNKNNTGSCHDAAVKSRENVDISASNDELIHCQGNNTHSDFKENRNLDNCGGPMRSLSDEDGRKPLSAYLSELSELLSKGKNGNAQGSSSTEDPIVDISLQDLGMIDYPVITSDC